MPALNDMYPSKYLKAEDLRGKDGKGWREYQLTVKNVGLEEMGGESNEKKWVLHFEKAEKGLVLNRTNAQTLADAYGDESDEWLGQKVVLFVMTVTTPQGPKPGIRIRAASNSAQFDPDEIPV